MIQLWLMNIGVFECLSFCSVQGGVDDELTLSAYITIALLEMPLPVTVCTGTVPLPPSQILGISIKKL